MDIASNSRTRRPSSHDNSTAIARAGGSTTGNPDLTTVTGAFSGTARGGNRTAGTVGRVGVGSTRNGYGSTRAASTGYGCTTGNGNGTATARCATFTANETPSTTSQVSLAGSTGDGRSPTDRVSGSRTRSSTSHAGRSTRAAGSTTHAARDARSTTGSSRSTDTTH